MSKKECNYYEQNSALQYKKVSKFKVNYSRPAFTGLLHDLLHRKTAKAYK